MIDLQVLAVGAAALVAGGLVLGVIIGMALGSIRSERRSRAAYDQHQIQRRIADVNPPAYGGDAPGNTW